MTDTQFLKCIAILLITNSHLDRLVPVSWLTAGGSLGNSLFFMLSGLGLSLSNRAQESKCFFHWLKYRLLRLYPSLWLVVFFVYLLIMESWKEWQLLDYVRNFIYPTAYWFIEALTVFYILFYPISRFGWRKKLPVIIALLMVPYFYFYFTVLDLSRFSIEDGGYFKWIFYFQIMLFGSWLALSYEQFKKPGPQEYLLLISTCLAYLGLKFLIAHGQLLPFQFLVQWITFPFVYLCLRIAKQPAVERLVRSRFCGSLILVLAACTLEIYLLQHAWYTSPVIEALSFPANIIAFWLVLVPAAYGVHRLADPLSKWLRK